MLLRTLSSSLSFQSLINTKVLEDIIENPTVHDTKGTWDSTGGIFGNSAPKKTALSGIIIIHHCHNHHNNNMLSIDLGYLASHIFLYLQDQAKSSDFDARMHEKDIVLSLKNLHDAADFIK